MFDKFIITPSVSDAAALASDVAALASDAAALASDAQTDSVARERRWIGGRRSVSDVIR